MIKRLLTLATDKIYNLPVIVLMPHSRCNCRCVMCDIWKANQTKKEISVEELQKHVHHFNELKVREVVFSGGEALMHPNLWKLCELLRKNGMKITLLSTGLLLEKNASGILANFDEVIVSIDGPALVHDKIRNVPNGFEKIAAGVRKIKDMNSSFRITVRSVLQRYNFHELLNTVAAAKEIGVDQISFLAADVSTAAFNHAEQLSIERVGEIALNKEEVIEFETIVERSFIELKSDYHSKFIAESPSKMRKIVQHYKAINGVSEYAEAHCNAPWVSAVIESDGNVLPCFFHKAYGNIYQQDFLEIINSKEAIAFRKNLNISSDPICKKCVCSLHIGINKMN